MVGLSLGLTGGGGSIFAMPMLIYGLGLPPASAVPVSLVAVAMTALVGGVHAVRAELVVWQPAIVFSAGGMLGAPVGHAAAHFLPAEGLVGGFALLALVVGLLMWRRASLYPEQASAVRAEPTGEHFGPVCLLAADGQLRFTTPCALVLCIAGLVTGFLSGLFGVGGGFLIVPALVFVTRIGLHGAVGTSLVIIGAIGFSGAASAILHGHLDWTVLAPFVLGGAGGMTLGRRFASRIAGAALQKGFSALIVLVGVVMLLDSALEIQSWFR